MAFTIIMGGLTIIGIVITIINFFLNRGDRNSDKGEKLNERLHTYMPRAEIEGKFKHVETNQKAASDAAVAKFRENDNEIVALKIEQGIMKKAHENLEDDVREIKDIIKEKMEENKTFIKERSDETKQMIRDLSEGLNHRMDSMEEVEATHFKETTSSIREARNSTIKPAGQN
jgi:DNA anti-recombination protein RmuC